MLDWDLRIPATKAHLLVVLENETLLATSTGRHKKCLDDDLKTVVKPYFELEVMLQSLESLHTIHKCYEWSMYKACIELEKKRYDQSFSLKPAVSHTSFRIIFKSKIGLRIINRKFDTKWRVQQKTAQSQKVGKCFVWKWADSAACGLRFHNKHNYGRGVWRSSKKDKNDCWVEFLEPSNWEMTQKEQENRNETACGTKHRRHDHPSINVNFGKKKAITKICLSNVQRYYSVISLWFVFASLSKQSEESAWIAYQSILSEMIRILLRPFSR